MTIQKTPRTNWVDKALPPIPSKPATTAWWYQGHHRLNPIGNQPTDNFSHSIWLATWHTGTPTMNTQVSLIPPWTLTTIWHPAQYQLPYSYNLVSATILDDPSLHSHSWTMENMEGWFSFGPPAVQNNGHPEGAGWPPAPCVVTLLLMTPHNKTPIFGSQVIPHPV